VIEGKRATKKVLYDGLFQIVGKNPLPKYSKTTFKILKYGDKNSLVVFGIITASRK